MENNVSKYIRVTKTLADKGQLVKPEEVQSIIEKDRDSDYYTSTYYYNDEHFKRFKEKGSIAGIKDVKTDKIWFDFDAKDNPSEAKKDTQELLKRFTQYNIDPKDAEIYFSGNKGFNVVLNLNKEINPEQVKAIANKFAKGLKTFDTTLYDTSQILRVPFTKHQISGLYKIPLSSNQLELMNLAEIKVLAEANFNPLTKTLTNKPKVNIDDSLFEVEAVKREVVQTTDVDFDWKQKPKYWKASKWALAQGYFQKGERHQALMILAATCRGMGYDKLTAYYICKGALNRSVERYGQGSTTKDELWNNIIDSVYSEFWNGGQYSDKNEVLLQTIKERLDIKEDSKEILVNIDGAFEKFTEYAKNIDALTIKTGIEALDKRLRMTIGMSVGIVAAPGVGKTSLALQILNNMSKQGHKCILFSYDMFHALILQKLAQKHVDVTPDELFENFKNGEKEFQEDVRNILNQEYANVQFCFEGGQSPDDIIETIKKANEDGNPVKLIVVDYNELVISNYSDPTQASAFVAQKMRQIAIDYNLCAISLFQPNKMSGSPSDELTSYRSAKGSSAIEQSVSVMLGMSRPGFNPRNPDQDKYVTISALKNRMGSIFSVDLHWDGLTGSVRSLTHKEMLDLNELREQKENNENERKQEWS